MKNRILSLAVCLAAASWPVFGTCTAAGTARFVMELPPAGSRFQGYSGDENCQQPVVDANGPSGLNRIIAKPDGSKFYLLGSGGVQSTNSTFTAFFSLAGLTGTPASMAISPDGRYLYVGGAGLSIFDTVSDAALTNGVSTVGNVVGTVFSSDSRYAFVLSTAGFGSSLVKVDTGSRLSVGAALSLQPSDSITMSPQQLIYITSGSLIYEIDPATMTFTPTGQIATRLSALGPLRFTPDGSAAYAVNLLPIDGQPLLRFDTPTHTVSAWLPTNTSLATPTFVDVFPASASRVFALTGPDITMTGIGTTIWDVTPTAPPSAVPSTSLGLGSGVNNVLSATLSAETPSARYLYLLIANGQQSTLERFDLIANQVAFTQNSQSANGQLQYASVPPQSGAAGFVRFNDNQNVRAGVAVTLGAVVTNSGGVPLYNVPATFSVDPASGIVLGSPAQTTNKDGYVQTTATLPSTSGTYFVKLTAGSATTTFTVTVSATGSTPGGGGSQVTIVSGNGMLMYSGGFVLNNPPLTVKVTDQNGKPLVNEPVSFGIISGPGQVSPSATLTDAGGFASARFQPSQIQQGLVFQSTDVQATARVGTVDFVETTYSGAPTDPGAYFIDVPSGGDFVGGAGDFVPDAVIGRIFSGRAPVSPIPNVAIRLSDPNDTTLPGPASCQGNYLSDQSGLAHCNVQIGCTLGTFGLNVVVGDAASFRGSMTVGPGTSQKIGVASGNNQSGPSGRVLPLPLVARVADNCGNTFSGVQVSWRITQGSATLSSTTTQTDGFGNVSTKVTLGQIPGVVLITATISGSQATFTATNTVAVGSVTLQSGNNQSTFTSQTFPLPLVFVVKDTNGNVLPGVQVAFSVTSGSASLSAAGAVTDSNGQVSVTVTAGSTPGTVNVAASLSGVSAAATLTVAAPGPVLTAASFTNAASNKPGLVSCGFGTATGPGVAPSITGVVLGNPPFGIGPLPYTIATTSLTVAGKQAPLYSLSNVNGVQQAIFQTPCEVPAGAATVAVTVNGTTTSVAGVSVLGGQPGIFTYAGGGGKAYGAVIRGTDGSYVTPGNLARRGETYYIVATGLGQTTPAATTNTLGTGQTVPTSQLIVGVNNRGVPIVSAAYVAIGVYYVGFQLPTDAPTGADQPLSLAQVVNGQVVYDSQGAFLAGVQ